MNGAALTEGSNHRTLLRFASRAELTEWKGLTEGNTDTEENALAEGNI